MAARKTRTTTKKRSTTRSKSKTTRTRNSKTGAQLELKPPRDEIARRAYEIWLDNGCPHGRDQHIWLQAEKELAGMKG
mgnify:CR=1 FL=1